MGLHSIDGLRLITKSLWNDLYLLHTSPQSTEIAFKQQDIVSIGQRVQAAVAYTLWQRREYGHMSIAI